ncbi:beta-ketoacyl-[acyl-carrier-protein] synthase family protein [Micromonospora sp. NPDC049175]|uniref:beta-ketoacyl-[acyl-carrier-protein] synthase family protein n=1 Tax=Micromonospora sp. NPDC049175 TaxID=3364266 RepID=UPI0037227209
MTGDSPVRHRVAVTGLSARTPAGDTPDTLWTVLRSGRSVIGPIRSFDASGLATRIAGEIQGFDPTAYLTPKMVRQTDRVSQLAFAAALDAFTDADTRDFDPDRCAVVVGTGMGGSDSFYRQVRAFIENGPDRISPWAIPMIMPNAAASLIARHLRWRGPNFCISTACTAGANAIGEGVRLIRDGSADVVLAGGAEAAVNPIVVAGFARMHALSTRNAEPETASRPFDGARDGFVLAEGAAFVLLERLDRALARGARVHGEVTGYGFNSDAYHSTMPHPEGRGAVHCMRLALRDAGVDPADVAHINAHGTSTTLNDAAEAQAIHTVFGGAAPPTTSTKGTLGHLIGAAGAVEVVASLLALRHGEIPPTANLSTRGSDIPIDVVADAPRAGRPGPILTNSFAFGGHNASLVLASVDDGAAVVHSN